MLCCRTESFLVHVVFGLYDGDPGTAHEKVKAGRAQGTGRMFSMAECAIAQKGNPKSYDAAVTSGKRLSQK